MLVPFVLEPHALHEAQGIPAEVRAAHERFIHLWSLWGVMVMQEADKELFEAYKRLPQHVRKRWESALGAARVRPTRQQVPHFHKMCKPDDLKGLQGLSRLAIVTSDRCHSLGVPEDAGSHVHGELDIEVARFTCVDQTKRFQEVQDLANRPISPGTTPESLWAERFAPVAQFTKSVKIVDPWLGERFLNSRNRAKTSLGFLLRKIGKLSKPASLSVFTICKGESMGYNLAVEAKEIASKHGLKFADLTFYIAGEEAFKRLDHDRFIRFETLIFELGNGCAVFEPDHGGARDGDRTTLMTVKQRTREHKRLEEALRKACEKVVALRAR